MFAAAHNHVRIIDLFNVIPVKHISYTFSHYFQLPVVQLLLEKGADKKLRNRFDVSLLIKQFLKNRGPKTF
jgi:hypothetical protein